MCQRRQWTRYPAASIMRHRSDKLGQLDKHEGNAKLIHTQTSLRLWKMTRKFPRRPTWQVTSNRLPFLARGMLRKHRMPRLDCTRVKQVGGEAQTRKGLMRSMCTGAHGSTGTCKCSKFSVTCATPPVTVQPPQKVDTSLVMAQQSATEMTITTHIICNRWAASSVPAVITEKRCVSWAPKCWLLVAKVCTTRCALCCNQGECTNMHVWHVLCASADVLFGNFT